MKPKAISVYIDDETALAFNRLRETIRQPLENKGIQSGAPPLGWLARSLLREKLGMVNTENDVPNAL